MSSPAYRRCILCVVAFLVVACGDESSDERLGKVLHLDPRLPDGSSSALALEAQRTVVAEWSFQDASAWPGEWELDSGAPGGKGAHGGLELLPKKGGDASPSLRYLGQLDATQVNGIEVELAIPGSARATATWFGTKPKSNGYAVSLTEPVSGLQTLSFDLAGRPTWTGEIPKLILKMSSNKTQGFELKTIRLLHEPLAWGASPLDPDRKPGPGDSGDAGLVERGGDSVRAWPVSKGERLLETVHVPLGGKLSVQVARSQTSSPEPLIGRVVAGELSATVELPEDDETWHAVTLDLATLAGQDVELEFHAEGEASDVETQRADVLFGAPLVFGTLPEDRLPNVLLVTLDTTRFDALGSSQAAANKNGETEPQTERVQTPALDAFAASSFVFENAWSAGNSTQPSHASIITGIAIQDHGLKDNFGMLSDGAITLAERMRAAGYQTAAVTCQRAISPASGFGQGFDMFVPAEAVSGADGRLAVDDAIEWLEEWADAGERPFFLWVHVFDPHTPYELPGNYLETYSGRVGAPPPRQVSPPTLPQVEQVPPELAFLGDINSRDHVNYLYHAEVSYTDHLMDDLLSTLERTGIAEHTLSVITADHGEFLGERGNYFNHRGLFPETLHVPLVLHLPGQLEGRHISDRVTNRDIVPTVLSALGLIDPGGPRDLVQVAASGADPERRLWFEHANGLQVGCRDAQYHFFTVLRDGYRFGMRKGPNGQSGGATPIPNGAVFIFDWTKDPGLTHNLADEEPELKAKYLELLEEYRAKARPVGSQRRAVSAEEEADLEALGYTGD